MKNKQFSIDRGEFGMTFRENVMGMPLQIVIDDKKVDEKDFGEVFNYLRWVDETFSPFKKTSEVGKFNRNQKFSEDLKNILRLCAETKSETNGYFDCVRPDGKMDPSGIVKGWAIFNAAKILRKKSYKKFYVDIAGDAEVVGKNWKWGIRNPFNVKEIIKILSLGDNGIATSGTYERGQHIYNPITKKSEITDIISFTVIGPNVYEADRFATGAFAMGKNGISFIESVKGLEGYMIDNNRMATMTSGFKKYETN